MMVIHFADHSQCQKFSANCALCNSVRDVCDTYVRGIHCTGCRSGNMRKILQADTFSACLIRAFSSQRMQHEKMR